MSWPDKYYSQILLFIFFKKAADQCVARVEDLIFIFRICRAVIFVVTLIVVMSINEMYEFLQIVS